ncbi:MAG TPA: hypothetical protein VLK24_05370 [Gaiellaceae bacterium]|nr:hypothetical protein [Gaiellaceae bacterium]
MLVVTGLLLTGVGAAVAIADDNAPATSPEACTVVTPNNAPANAADAVSAAANDVSSEADTQSADDEQGDVQNGEQGDNQNNQSGEQGDCNDDNNDDGDQGDG